MGVRIRRHRGKPYVFVNHRKIRRAFCCNSLREAEATAARLRAMIIAGVELKLPVVPEAPEAPPLTLRAFVEDWRQTHAPSALKASTLRAYNTYLDRHILPLLGDHALADIRRADCKALIAAGRDKGLHSKSLSNLVRVLSTVLTEAVERGELAVNPAFRLGRYCKVEEEIPHTIQPLTREQAAALLTTAKARAPEYYPLVLTALRTGMRLGELLGLEWGDIDFGGGFILVRRNRVQGRITTPKSGKSRRVDMSPQLARELKALLAQRKATALRTRTSVPPTVFLAPEGGPIDADNFRKRVFEPLVQRAGLHAIRFHDLRHTFATLLIAQGEPLPYIRDQLGHSSIKITVDVYGHLIPGANRAAVARLDDPPCSADASPRNHEGESGGRSGAPELGVSA